MDVDRHRAAEAAYWRHEGVEPVERWVQVGRGPRLRVLEVGDGSPVLFVHGASNGGTSWASLAARLPGFRCLLLDRPGCGLSEPAPRVRTIAELQQTAAGLLADVLDGLEVPSAHLVATSLGGYHALTTAATHPGRVQRVVVLGFPIGAPHGPVPVVMRLAGARRLGKAMARLPVGERAVRALLGSVGLRQALRSGRMPQEGVDWYRSLLNHTRTMANDLDAAPAVIRPFSGMNDAVLLSDAVLGRIQAPVRFVWGDEDRFGGAEVARAFAPRVPGAELHVVPGGHAVWMDDPDRVAALTGEFLAG